MASATPAASAASKTPYAKRLPAKPSPATLAASSQSHAPRPWTRTKLTTLIGLVAIATAALAGVSMGVGYFARPAKPSDSAPVAPAPSTSPDPTQRGEPIVLPSEQPARPMPVRFTNPFDKNEVFEFPPGTSQTEARDAVAARLLERARQRRGGTAPLERVSSTNSPHHP